ncbi:MAG: SpoIIE family protein phosphatase [Armatimonadota bacterium]|nr:SpoIIE family protein phosphatase [bacterium]
MSIPIWPKSIRGKLILIFLTAVGPVLCVQICEHAVRSLLPSRDWLMVSIVASVMGLLIMSIVGNRFTSPVMRLARAASAVAAGDFRKRVRLDTGDELETLANAFNSIGQSLISHEAILKRQADVLARMVDAARVASSSLDMRKCGRSVAKAVCSHLGASDAVVFRKDGVDGGFKVLGSNGGRHGVAWKRLASHVADSGGYLVMSEQASESDGEAVLVGIPLAAGSDTLGAIVARFDTSVSRGELSVGGIMADALTAFGIHAAAAISNAEAYSQTEKYSEVLEDWVEHLSLVMQVTNAISPSLDLDETLHALASATASAIGTDECAIYLRDGRGKLTVRSCCNNDEPISALKINPGESVTGRAYAEKQYAACTDGMRSSDPSVRRASEQVGLRAALCSPLLIQDNAIGAITVYNKEPHKFTPREIRLLTSIALHAAVLVRNAGMYTRESSIAEKLQMGLISKTPKNCRGLSFASRYIPALDEARVGGDFYDVESLPNGGIGVVIGDVSGKGLQAAIHLAACKYMMKALMFAYPDDPGRVLGELNDAMNHYFDLSFFVTVFYGIIYPSEKKILYASAGHPPGLLITHEGRLQDCLSSTGTPVGSGQDCCYETVGVRFEPSDMLLLYTDGVTDVSDGSQLLGVDGVQRLVFEAAPCPASDLVEYICDQLQCESGSSKDDVALLAVSFETVEPVCETEIGGPKDYGHYLAAHTA